MAVTNEKTLKISISADTTSAVDAIDNVQKAIEDTGTEVKAFKSTFDANFKAWRHEVELVNTDYKILLDTIDKVKSAAQVKVALENAPIYQAHAAKYAGTTGPIPAPEGLHYADVSGTVSDEFRAAQLIKEGQAYYKQKLKDSEALQKAQDRIEAETDKAFKQHVKQQTIDFIEGKQAEYRELVSNTANKLRVVNDEIKAEERLTKAGNDVLKQLEADYVNTVAASREKLNQKLASYQEKFAAGKLTQKQAEAYSTKAIGKYETEVGTAGSIRDVSAAAYREQQQAEKDFNLVEQKLQETNKRREKAQLEVLAMEDRFNTIKAQSQANFNQNELEAEENANKARITTLRNYIRDKYEAEDAIAKAEQDAAKQAEALQKDNIAKADAARRSQIEQNLSSYKTETQQTVAELNNRVNLENAIRRFGADSQQAIAVRTAIEEQRIRTDLANKLAGIQKQVAEGTLSSAQAQVQVKSVTDTATTAIINNSKALDDNNRVIDKSKQQHKSLVTHITEVYGAYQILNTVAGAAKKLIMDIPSVGMQQERTRASLGAIFGSEEGFKNIKFLEELSMKAGAYIGDLQEAYTRFAPSAVLAGAKQEEVNKIFSDFTKVSTVLHFSTDQVKSLYLALEQMYAKTTVQSEEIKKQLGNVLPGAVEIGAQAWAKYSNSADKSVSAFMEAMKKNEVITRQFAPKFAEEYAKVFAGPDDSIFADISTKLQSNLARVQNMYFGFTTEMYEKTKGTINDVVKFTASAFETIKENSALVLQVTELVAISGFVRIAAALPTILVGLEKMTVLLTGFSTAGLAAVGTASALVGAILGINLGYEKSIGLTLEYQGVTASLTDVLRELASTGLVKVNEMFTTLSDKIDAYVADVKGGKYKGVGNELLAQLLGSPGQTIKEWFINITSYLVAGEESLRQYFADKAIDLEDLVFGSSSMGRRGSLGKGRYGAGSIAERFATIRADFNAAWAEFDKDSGVIGGVMERAADRGVQAFVNQWKGKSYREIKEALVSISNTSLYPQITEADKRKLFASAVDFSGYTGPEANDPLKKNKPNKAAISEAYRSSLEEAKNAYNEIRADVAEALGNIDTMYKDSTMTIKDYFLEKRELIKTDAAVQRQMVEAERALAVAQADKVKISKLDGEIIKIQKNETKALTQAVQEQEKAERAYTDSLQKAEDIYNSLIGKRSTGIAKSFAQSHEADIKKFMAAYAKGGEEGDAAGKALQQLGAAQQLTVLKANLAESDERIKTINEDYNASIQKTNVLLNAGAIGQLSSLTQITAANEKYIDQLQKEVDLQQEKIDKAKEEAKAVDPADVRKLNTLKDKIEELKLTSNAVATHFEKIMGDAFTNSFESFVMGTATAKQAFKGFVTSVLQGIAKIIAQEIAMQALMNVIKPLAGMAISGIAGMFGPSTLAGNSAGFAAIMGKTGTDFWGAGATKLPFANGGVMSGAGISAYSGSVVDRPTVFPFANGIGLMGEAGAEAILPLKRNSQGKLGVVAGGAQGGVVQNSGNQYNVTVHVEGGKDQNPSDTGGKIGEAIIRSLAKEEIYKAQRAGNILNRTTKFA